MSFYPAGFDYNAPAARIFKLVNVNATDGDWGFILGGDGVFTDINNKTWYGSELINADALNFGLNAVAQASSITLSYFDDPVDPSDVITKLRAQGPDYVRGRPITFYKQCFDAIEDQYAPKYAPRAYAQMTMRHLTFDAPSPLVRTITVHLETEFSVRGGSENLVYNTADHARQVGATEPSYEFIPTEPRVERSLLS